MKGIITSDKIQKFSKLITEARRIAIATHTRPDGDAIGSCVATACFIREKFGKDAGIVLADPCPGNLDFIFDSTGTDRIFRYDLSRTETESWIAGCDLIICQDCNGFNRTGELKDTLKSSGAAKVLIDHHLDPQEAEFDLCFSETKISSASELVFWVLSAMPGIDGDAGLIPMHALRAIMTGMTTDTNNFANSVFPSTLQMASKLLEARVDRDGIIEELYNRYRENRLRMTGFALKDKMVILPEGAAFIILTADELAEYDIEEGELEGLVNMPLGIGSVKMSVLLKEDNGYFRVSVRSKRGVSANRFAAEYFNGGGHEQASGGRLYFPENIKCSNEAPEYVKKALTAFFKV